MIALLSLLLVASAPADSTDSASALVREAVAQYTAPHARVSQASQWRLAWIDVNDDGLLDAVALAGAPEWCGSGGCTMLVIEAVPEFDREELGPYAVAAEIELVSEPVRVSTKRNVGWCDFLVQNERGHAVRLQFDGETYPFSPAEGTPEAHADAASGDDPVTVLFAALD